jgi:uncharacterized protein (DUF1778 family)
VNGANFFTHSFRRNFQKKFTTTLNQFLVQAALEKAQHIIEKDTLIHLSKNDAEAFFHALETPSQPNTKLLDAVKHYRANIS